MTISDAVHENPSFLGKYEKPLLESIAQKLPEWVTPDLMTLVGFLGAVLILIGYILANFNRWFLLIPVFGYVLNWYGDSLDGTIARVRKIERRRYGFFIDHSVDAVVTLLMGLGSGFSPYFDFRLSLLFVIFYLMFFQLTFLISSIEGKFSISFGKLSPTEVRLILIGLTIGMFFYPGQIAEFSFGVFSIYDLIMVGFMVYMFFLYVSSVWKKGLEFRAIDDKENGNS